MEVSWLLLACVICLPRISFGVTPVTNCSEYVPENEDLRCNCLLPENVSGPANFSWSDGGNDSDAATLDIENVTRESNGTQYTCQMLTYGYNVSTVYTLRVAYGPFEEHMKIDSSDLTSNQELTLTCSATQVYPPPLYSWQGITCSNVTDNTCTFTPDVSGDCILNITCLARRVYIPGYGERVAIKSMLLDLSHRPLVTRLTLNNASNHLTVNGSEADSLSLLCEAFGRPTPNITIQRIGTLSQKKLFPVTEEHILWTKTALVTLPGVTYHDMGVYICTANNGVGFGHTKIIHLNVKCSPEKLDFARTLQMTRKGVSFKLTAYPVPDHVQFSYHDKQGSKSQGEIVPKEMFSFNCKQNTHIHSFVDCMIVPIEVPKESLGFYTANVSNELGSVNISFVIKSKVAPPADHSAVTGLVVGVALLVVIAIVLLIVWRKRRQLARLCARRRPYSSTARSSCPYDVIPMDAIELQPHLPRLPSRHSWPLPQIPEAGVPFSTLSQHDDDEVDQEHEQQLRVSGLLRPPRTSYEPMRQRTGPDSHRYSDLWRSSVLSGDDMFLHLLFENPHTVDAED
ncbi:hypothetical protein V1264_017618 [Littorina saxatilis]|uniref:Ig-like domain-containing protein n=1 Tax=Littorina saxatilis TaxID=31220 RepID=A0AAN9GET0_9CAEN